MNGEAVVRIVVPKTRREGVLRAIQSLASAGHFLQEENRRQVFTCPNISRDMGRWCRSCPECQRAGSNRLPKAKLQPLPVISTPFERMAVDLGPLQQTVRGLDGCVLVDRTAQGSTLTPGYCFYWQADEEAMQFHWHPTAEDLSIPTPDKWLSGEVA